MALYIASLNSGSNGNCYYVGDHEDAVFIDAGISCRETEKRMKRLGLNMAKVRAIFVSHEHTDHVAGVTVLAKKYGLPVYMAQGMVDAKVTGTGSREVLTYKAHVPVVIGNLEITAFPKAHDACDPHSFVVMREDIRVGVFTDLGRVCDQLIRYFSQCHAAFLEANYDTEMLVNGHYPYYLKNRIRGGNGHLSNAEALQLFKAHKPEFMSHVLLSHLSRENNDPTLVYNLFQKERGHTHVAVASRYEESPVYFISGTMQEHPGDRSPQMSLFAGND